MLELWNFLGKVLNPLGKIVENNKYLFFGNTVFFIAKLTIKTFTTLFYFFWKINFLILLILLFWGIYYQIKILTNWFITLNLKTSLFWKRRSVGRFLKMIQTYFLNSLLFLRNLSILFFFLKPVKYILPSIKSLIFSKTSIIVHLSITLMKLLCSL